MNKPYCLFISSHLPVDDIPIAGQKNAYRNLIELCETYNVILISFVSTIENSYFNPEKYKACYKTHFLKLTTPKKLQNILLNPFLPLRVSVRKNAVVEKLVQNYLGEYDIQLFRAEFTASMAYQHLLTEKIRKQTFQHDVVFQSLERQCMKGPLFRRLFYCFEYKRYKKWEVKKLKEVDDIFVLNDKDKSLLEEHQIKNIQVSFPQLDDWCYQVKRNSIEKYSIVFLGAMNRFENQDAITWFIKDIFPQVIEKFPTSKLYVVGSGVTEDIKKLESKSIVITGFVESPIPYFESAHIAVVPLRFGAGIKIKTLEMLAAKLPTVSTEIGAEGVPEDKNLYLANDEEKIVEMICHIFNKED